MACQVEFWLTTILSQVALLVQVLCQNWQFPHSQMRILETLYQQTHINFPSLKNIDRAPTSTWNPQCFISDYHETARKSEHAINDVRDQWRRCPPETKPCQPLTGWSMESNQRVRITLLGAARAAISFLSHQVRWTISVEIDSWRTNKITMSGTWWHLSPINTDCLLSKSKSLVWHNK